MRCPATRLFCFALFVSLAGLGATLHAADVLIADFEGPNYGGWQVEGEAFGSGPARGTLPNQMKVDGFRGQGLVNSFAGGDDSTGTLTSPPFTIEKPFINFLVGGGMRPGQACINLLVGGKVARTATGPNDRPGGSERLDWASWDVKELNGKQARIQIVDQATGGWGHINVDHIVQSDKQARAAAAERSRQIALDKQYLLFPITNHGPPCRMSVTLEGETEPLFAFDINLAHGEVDWWTHLDVSRWAGRTATVHVNKLPAESQGLARVEASDEIRSIRPLYDEKLRPQLRFSQMRGWNNDPNGMVYYDGEYHFCWQSNPFGRAWANMFWGHAVSTDLVHWKQRPYALYPFTMARDKCFSGSGHVDVKDTAGWQTGDEKVLIAAFTDTGAGEAIAYSNDRGRTWTYAEENPVIRHRGRDPKLVWYEYGQGDTPISDEAKQLGGHWVIAVYSETQGIGRNIAFHTSTDLKQWTLRSHLPGYFECPELFELSVDGDENNRRWVVFAADAKYAVGRFDGKTFTPDHEGKHQVHWGPYYASQCFSRDPKGRVIQVGWARLNMPDMPFNQAFSLPTRLTLNDTADGIRMFARPIKELEVLRQEPLPTDAKTVSPEQPIRFATDGQLYDIVVDVEPGDAREVILRFGGNQVRYDVAGGKLDEMPLKLDDGRLRFRVITDRPMYEVCGGEGAVYKTSGRKGAGEPIDAIELSVGGREATIHELNVYPMRSIWEK